MGSWGAGGEGNRESLTCVHRVKVGDTPHRDTTCGQMGGEARSRAVGSWDAGERDRAGGHRGRG